MSAEKEKAAIVHLDNADENLAELARCALEGKERALPLYSKFYVGAAIRTKDGQIYNAGNIECSSYGLTTCAERIALFKALSENERQFDAVVIATDTDAFCPPCGACRQVLWDFAPDIIVYSMNSKLMIKKELLRDLLPNAFDAQLL